MGFTDKSDWALLKIVPLHYAGTPTFPPALRIAPTGFRYADLDTAKFQDIFALGHPYGTALKLADVKDFHPESSPDLRNPRSVLANYYDGQGDNRVALEWSLRHNNISHGGNSGGPLFLRSANAAEAPIVIGSTNSNGLALNGPSLGILPTIQIFLVNVPRPADAPEKKELRITNAPVLRSQFHVATRTSCWYHLINPSANVVATVAFTPEKGARGYLQLFMRVLLPATQAKWDSVLDIKLYTSPLYEASQNPVSIKTRVIKNFKDAVAHAQLNAADVPRMLPCHIVGMMSTFTESVEPPSPFTSNGTLDLLTVSVTGDITIPDTQTREQAKYDVVIMRETGKIVNVQIDRPDFLPLRWKDQAFDDAQGIATVRQ